MKSRLKVTKWIVRITSLSLLIATGYLLTHLIKYLETSPPYISEVQVCESEKECNLEELNQGVDNLYVHIDVEGKLENEKIFVEGVYILDDIEYQLFEITEEINGDEVINLEKDLKNGWLIGQYYIEVSLVGDNSNVIHTTFDIMAGS